MKNIATKLCNSIREIMQTLTLLFMKKISLILSFLCLSLAGAAQDNNKLDFWGVGFGLQYANFDNVNGLLQEAGFPSVRNFAAPSFSLVFGSKNDKFVNFFDGGISMSKNKSNNFTSSTMFGSIKTLLGYDLLNKEKLSLYPLFSIGFSNASINIAQQSTPNTISNYLANAPTEKTLYYEGSINLGAAIGGHYRFSSDFTLGFLTGYSYPLGQGRWRVEGQRLEDRLRTNAEGFYFKIIVGSFK